MFVYMNFNGQMKRITNTQVLKKSVNLRKEYFQDIAEVEHGFMMPKNGRYGYCNIAIQYFDEEIGNLFALLKKYAKGYISCVDFQDIGEINKNSYGDYLNEAYNSSVDHNFTGFINAGFMYGLIFGNKNEMLTCQNALGDVLSDQGMIMAPCVGIQRRVFESIASLGIYDFHAMRCVNSDSVYMMIG